MTSLSILSVKSIPVLKCFHGCIIGEIPGLGRQTLNGAIPLELKVIVDLDNPFVAM